MSVRRDDRGGAGPVWLDLLPGVAFAATFGVFFVEKSSEARTVLRSGRGLLALGAVVAGYLVVSLALRRTARRIAPVVMAGVVVGLAAWTRPPVLRRLNGEPPPGRGPGPRRHRGACRRRRPC